MTSFNGLYEVDICVVDTLNDVCITLSVCCPLDNDLVKPVSGFEVTMWVSAWLDQSVSC